MIPVIALVGRPNVGKSTLFNQLTRSRDALVANFPGLTRDRKYGEAKIGSRPFVVIDTGGISGEEEGIDTQMAGQSLAAIEEADAVLFMVDAREGLNATDEALARHLRQRNKSFHLVVNKIDGLNEEVATGDFYSLGIESMYAIAASHGRGVRNMIEQVLESFPDSETSEEDDPYPNSTRVAVIGRPNVGKSTLVNRLLGEERVVVYDQPGTTRDSIYIDYERDDREYTLIDTAGVRRRSRISEIVERFSTIKALQAIERAHVVVLMLDAREGLTDQDATLLGHVLNQGRALVIALNKWDGLDQDHRKRVKSELDRKLTYVDWAQRVTLSALHGSGIQELLDAVHRAWKSALADFSTPELTRVLKAAFEAHQPPMKQGRVAKLRYAHSGGKLPPRIVIHGSRTDTIPDSYRRYLVNRFIKHFKLRGTPVFLDFRNSDNPYKDKKNKLTRRQMDKRKRLKKFTGRKSKK